jgi:hypothetical protein
MRRLLLFTMLVLAGTALLPPGQARAAALAECTLPSDRPLWIDFGTPDAETVFGRPGVVLSASTGDFPARMRAKGAKTVFWDMNLRNRIGTPVAPTATDGIVEKANRLYEFAATQMACRNPIMALNELQGAQLETPWSANNAQYRANVMTFIKTLADRGARPYLLVSSEPYRGSDDALAWWREAAEYATLVREVYFHVPTISKLGVVLGNRRLRTAMRRGIAGVVAMGIKPSRVGLMLGFHTGSSGLKTVDYLRTVKWQALAARQVARELSVPTVWSWGWASYTATANRQEKLLAGCVYLWTRNQRLCNGPAAAGTGFQASLTEGQLRLPARSQCVVGRTTISQGMLSSVARLTGDRDVAFSILLGRLAEQPYANVPTNRVLAAERAVIATRFGGRRSAYLSALAKAGAGVAIARAALADELRRLAIESRMRARAATNAEVDAFYAAYPELRTRRVQAKPAPWWLGGRTQGFALEQLAPAQLFGLPTGRKAAVLAFDGRYSIRPLGEVQPLGSLPRSQAGPMIAAALRTFARRAAFETWSVARQENTLRNAICAHDELPVSGTTRLSDYLQFLLPTG